LNADEEYETVNHLADYRIASLLPCFWCPALPAWNVHYNEPVEEEKKVIGFICAVKVQCISQAFTS
jgi:hypothetical protein